MEEVAGLAMTNGTSSHSSGSEATAGACPRLLVVEDNMVNQKVAVAMLAKLGYQADVVANGAEALEAVARTPYGAVLMDCQMPEMDGYAAATEIRRREQGGQHVPIIAMTAGAMPGDRQRCLAAGMDDYIAKPVKMEHLASVLGHWTPPSDPGDPHADAPAADGGDDLLDADQIGELRALLGAPNGGEQLAKLVTTFHEGALSRLSEIRAAIAADDTGTVGRVAHSLAGSAATLGARVVHEIARELEAGTTTDRQGLDDLVDRLGAAVDEVAPMLRTALAARPASQVPGGPPPTGDTRA